jgi:hypothetical protein
MGKLTVNRGTTFTIDIIYKKNNVAASLAGSTIRFTAKTTEYDDSTTDATAAIVKDITAHTDAPNGLSSITIDPTDTATLEPGRYNYDIKVAEAGGAIYKIDEGQLTLDGSPTNRLT